MRLGIPLPGDDTVAELTKRYGHLLLKWLLEIPPAELPPPIRAAYAGVLRPVALAARQDAAGLCELLLSPSISTLLNLIHMEQKAQRSGEATDPDVQTRYVAEVLPLIGYELARTERLGGATLNLPRTTPVLWSIAQGLKLELDAQVRGFTFTDGSLRLQTGDDHEDIALSGDGPGESTGRLYRATRVYLPLRGGHQLALHDNNPQYDLELHPDKSGNSLTLGDHPASEWVSALDAAQEMIDQALPGYREEQSAMLRQIVPVGYDPEKHLSASYQANIGTLYMTLHPNVMTLAEAIIHEFQHNKLNALMNMDPIVLNSPDERYTSPVRPDPRPILGIVLAVHAFIPVSEMYRVLETQGHDIAKSGFFRERWRQIIQKNDDGMQVVLRHGRMSPRGQAVINELAAENTRHLALGI